MHARYVCKYFYYWCLFQTYIQTNYIHVREMLRLLPFAARVSVLPVYFVLCCTFAAGMMHFGQANSMHGFCIFTKGRTIQLHIHKIQAKEHTMGRRKSTQWAGERAHNGQANSARTCCPNSWPLMTSSLATWSLRHTRYKVNITQPYGTRVGIWHNFNHFVGKLSRATAQKIRKLPTVLHI